MPHRPLLALALGALLALGWAVADAAEATWLDGSPHGWNAPGAPVPTAPVVAPNPVLPCGRGERAPSGAEEAQLAGTGWKLESYWPTQRAGGVALVTALAGYDGMCRPLDFNGFVFVGGRFVGTLAPRPMASREDGTLVGTPSVSADGRVVAEFTRYSPTDALCCPSRGRTRVSYAVADGVLVPQSFTAVPPAAVGAPATQLPRTGGPAAAIGLAAGAFAVGVGLLLRRSG